MSAISHEGVRYGRLVGIARAKSATRRVIWLWQCDCGNQKEIAAEHVKSGHTRSCGCLFLALCAKHRHAHDANGQQTPTYKAWANMKSRAGGRSESGERNYLARGISVCEQWRNSFEVFLRDVGECPPGLSLDRIDNDGNYEPGNCRWATPVQQTRNRRRTIWVTLNGKEMTITEACEISGLVYATALARIHLNGMTPQQAVEMGPGVRGRRISTAPRVPLRKASNHQSQPR